MSKPLWHSHHFGSWGQALSFPRDLDKDHEDKVRMVGRGIVTFREEEDALFVAGCDGTIELTGSSGIEIDVVL